MYDLSGKVAIVTGAFHKKGMGCGIALRLAREGADVAVNDILKAPEGLAPWERDEGWHGLESLVDEIRSLGRRALAVTADVSNNKQVNDLVSKVVEQFGKVDILVNNAATTSKGLPAIRVVELDEETWNWAMANNLTSVFLMCKAVARQMLKQGHGGKIINISSRQGKVSVGGYAAYCASKAGIISLTQTLALELGKDRIYVNAVCPGPTLTWGSKGDALYEAMKMGLTEDEAVAKVYVGEHNRPNLGALGKLGKVEDVANVVAFLASNQSDHMTGQAINVTGGRLMTR